MKPFVPGRRRRALLSLIALLPLAALPARAQKSADRLRIGYQKSSTLLTLIKARGTLEQRLAALGVTVSWHEFASGLPLLEALGEQQRIADSFYAEGLLPVKVDASALPLWHQP